MNGATRARRGKRASASLEKFEKNPRMTECAVFQDKSGFLLQIPVNSQNNCVYFKKQKKNVPNKNFCHQANRLCVK